MKSLKRVGIVGEAMGELFTQANHSVVVGVGGDTFNAAAYMAQMQTVAQPHFFSAIGTDPFSELLLERCTEFGVQTSSIITDPLRSIGLYSISNDANGERFFHYWRSDSAARHYLNDLNRSDILTALLQCDALFLSGITLAVMQPEARHHFIQTLTTYSKGRIYFDDNYRPNLWGEGAGQWYQDVFQVSDYLLLSVDDQLVIQGLKNKSELIDRLSELTDKIIVLRDGHKPITIVHKREVTELAIPAVTAVDTTAAGDSFSGTFIALTEAGIDVIDAAQQAANVSAFVVQQAGALVKLPTALRHYQQ